MDDLSNLIKTFSSPLRSPVRMVRARSADGVVDPKLIAGGEPVTPLNVALTKRRQVRGATSSSLDAYTRAAKLYARFCALSGLSLLDMTDADFQRFKSALLNESFQGVDGDASLASPDGRARGARTADQMIALIYSLAGDIEELYGVRFEWRRYGRLPNDLLETLRAFGGGRQITVPRAHGIKFIPRKVLALPDSQFVKLVRAARDLWFDDITDGDKAFASDTEEQRGALYWRNVAILFVLRFAGGRRSEPCFITLKDVRRKDRQLDLVSKGRGGGRLPTVLCPLVDRSIWHYVTRFRPEQRESLGADEVIFLSHSVRNYGRPITPQTVRKLVDVLKKHLDTPWNQITTPHMLRHAFAHQIQRVGGDVAVTAAMRHASSGSIGAYAAGVENFLDEMLGLDHLGLDDLLAEAGLSDSSDR